MLPHGYERVCDDLERTTRHTLTLRAATTTDQYGRDAVEVVEVLLDGTIGGYVSLPGGVVAEEAIAALADELQGAFLDEFIWGGWPTCPRHRTHPLEAVVKEGTASWCCPVDGGVLSAIGTLRELG